MVSSILIRWVITSLTIFMVPHLIPGVRIQSAGTAVAAAAVLAALNLLVRPLLVILTLPLTIFSLGFFLLILNALIFMLAGSIVHGMEVKSFTSAFLASLLVSFVGWLLSPRKSSARLNVRVFRTGGRGPMGSPGRSRTEKTVELTQGDDGEWK